VKSRREWVLIEQPGGVRAMIADIQLLPARCRLLTQSGHGSMPERSFAFPLKTHFLDLIGGTSWVPSRIRSAWRLTPDLEKMLSRCVFAVDLRIEWRTICCTATQCC
jgi:hypothetical protein